MFLAQTIGSWIMLAGGLVACWYAFRPIPEGPRQDEWEAWHARWGRLLRIIGPLLSIYAIVRILSVVWG
jgi:hypothetical protein